MGSNKNYVFSDNAQELFTFQSEKEEIEHIASMLSFSFLSEIEKLMKEKGMTKKELAALVNTSSSYITQLFRGNKLLNLEMIAKFQKVFNITFSCKAKKDTEHSDHSSSKSSILPDFDYFYRSTIYENDLDDIIESIIVNHPCKNTAA